MHTLKLSAVLAVLLGALAGCRSTPPPQGSEQTINELRQTVISMIPRADGLTIADVFRWTEIQIEEKAPELNIKIRLSKKLPQKRALSDAELSVLSPPLPKDSSRPPRKGDPGVVNINRVSALDLIRYFTEICELEYRIDRSTVIIEPLQPSKTE